MRVSVRNIPGLESRLASYGCEIVPVKEAELVLSNEIVPVYNQTKARVIGRKFTLARPVMEVNGIDVGSNPCYFLTRWFEQTKWLDQVLVGFSLDHLGNDNTGPSVRVGMGYRFLPKGTLEPIFSTSSILQWLKSLNFSGFVTIGIDKRFRICSVETNWTDLGLYPLLEGANGYLLEFLMDPINHPLSESWTMGLLVSVWPFPYLESPEPVRIPNITSAMARHFYQFASTGHKSTQIGMATGWAYQPSKANFNALKTLKALQLDGKQYRTDGGNIIQSKWLEFRSLLNEYQVFLPSLS